ncbi:hypothetical protein ABZP36_034917 [Zizania latifolia]
MVFVTSSPTMMRLSHCASLNTYSFYVSAFMYITYVSMLLRHLGQRLVDYLEVTTAVRCKSRRCSTINVAFKPDMTMASDGSSEFKTINVAIDTLALKRTSTYMLYSDQSVLYECQFDGYQDTLYTHTSCQYYHNCTITDTIDFIFKNTQVLFQNCHIQFRRRMDNQQNIMIAQGCKEKRSEWRHSDSQLHHRALPGVKGRRRQVPHLPQPAVERGWLPWSGDFGLNICYYAKVGNHGTDADISKRAKWRGVKLCLLKGDDLNAPTLSVIAQVCVVAVVLHLDIAVIAVVRCKSRRCSTINVVFKPNVTVASDDSGDFKTINMTMAKMTLKSTGTYMMYVKARMYNEYMSMVRDMSRLAMSNDGATKTIIIGNRSLMMNITTRDTVNMEAIENGFFMRGIDVDNTVDAKKHQTMALCMQNNQSMLYESQFDGYHDTLYTHTSRRYYRDCTITGTIDFIFENTQVLFQNCLNQGWLPWLSDFGLNTSYDAEVGNRGTDADMRKHAK